MPPASHVNKDFIKDILAERKKLLSMKDVKLVSVPKYEELSVKALYPQVEVDTELMMYFPT